MKKLALITKIFLFLIKTDNLQQIFSFCDFHVQVLDLLSITQTKSRISFWKIVNDTQKVHQCLYVGSRKLFLRFIPAADPSHCRIWFVAVCNVIFITVLLTRWAFFYKWGIFLPVVTLYVIYDLCKEISLLLRMSGCLC